MVVLKFKQYSKLTFLHSFQFIQLCISVQLNFRFQKVHYTSYIHLRMSLTSLLFSFVSGEQDGSGRRSSVLRPQRRPPRATPARPHGHPPLPLGKGRR